MKKLILTTFMALAMSGAAFAQGLINWNTFSSTAISGQTNSSPSAFFGGSGNGGTAAAVPSGANGGLYYYELLYNVSAYTGSLAATPNGSTLFGGTWLDTGLVATNSNSAGRLTGVNPNASAPIPWAQGTSNNVMIVAWSGDIGSTWGSVSNILAHSFNGDNSLLLAATGGANAFFGESALGLISPNTGPSAGATIFGAGSTPNGILINSGTSSTPIQLYLIPVPEPTTMALAGLGGLSLLLFRRRKV